MDMADVVVAILLIGCASWLVWARVASSRKARELGSSVADSAGSDGGSQPPGIPEAPSRLPPEAPSPSGEQASPTSTGRPAARGGRRRR